jgi:hypothetical protein
VIRSAAVVAVLASLLVGPAARASSGEVLVDQADKVDDVNIFDGGGTKPTTAQRKSIDLERFTVTRNGDGVRLSFRIARITRARGFDQIVTAQLGPPGEGGSMLELLASPRDKHATAYVGDHTVCLVDVATSRRTGTVHVDLPEGCVPAGAGQLTVTTYTQERNGSGPGFSEDRMRIKGTVALR